MIKAIFTALTGINDSIDSPEKQTAWEQQRYLDEHDLDSIENINPCPCGQMTILDCAGECGFEKDD
ncbi:hypothetical protein [Pseudanabaena mucicola]|uniref:CP12 domain-containing protein n=1 Tax=Pseudanabaena mucicola FACHB-723 TaxID=2692860 RepID=A0ABR8A183_9CYAN|nr:hypothetical protein [Pseudanabaena mucicola]MBD2190001.1 hypothetical protein [Pseudanabaena mucicola FACHB-723]